MQLSANGGPEILHRLRLPFLFNFLQIGRDRFWAHSELARYLRRRVSFEMKGRNPPATECGFNRSEIAVLLCHELFLFYPSLLKREETGVADSGKEAAKLTPAGGAIGGWI